MKPVIAKLDFRSPEEGGRKHRPTGPHYSTVAEFDGSAGGVTSEAWSIVATFRDVIDEEGCVTADVDFLAPDAPRTLLHQGARFTLLEGTRAVARGEIISSSVAAELERARARTLQASYAELAALVDAWRREQHLGGPDFDANAIERIQIQVEAA